MKNFASFEKEIGIIFRNKNILTNVFVHRSYLNEHKNFYLPSNEKMEFLGDSVLSLVTSMYLYKLYPDLSEGEYTEIKAAIVRTESLTEAAQKLELSRYLFLSRGQEREQGKKNINILADTFEALIGGIFLDTNFETAYQFVLKFLFAAKLDTIIKQKLFSSPKSRLQEYTQSKYRSTPIYKVVEEKGPEHDPEFKVVVYIQNTRYAQGLGKSKKEAEEKAAKKTLEMMV